MKWKVVFAIGICFTGVVCAEINNLSTYFPTNFSSQVSDVKERDHWFEEKCKKIGRHGIDEELVAAKLETQNCIVTLVNLTELQAEVHETALLGGNVGKVFSKFCRKFPALKNCITSFIATIEPCLNEEETEAVNFVQDVINSILDYICSNDGINILYFIMEGGPECVYSKQEAMKKCLNTLITKYPSEEETFSPDNSSAHAEGKDCRNVKILQTCIVTALHKCPQPTTASIFKNMLELVVMKLSCSNPEQASYVSKVLALPSKLYI